MDILQSRSDISTDDSNIIDLTPEKNGGVLKVVLHEGIGNEFPPSGVQVTVDYVGTMEDGSQFDSSREREEKFEFSLGKGEVIKAWDLGVATMKKGEVCKLICKSNYAYGEAGIPHKIPPLATLIFEIELYKWRGEDLSSKKDGSIVRRIIQNGEGYLTPNDGALVDVEIVGRINGAIFDQRELKFLLGEGSEHNIPEGLERALERFKKNERSIILLMPKYVFGSKGNADLNIPPNTSVEYEIYLRDFEKAIECWEMSQEEKLEQAKLCKTKGTNYFKQQKYRLAIKQYKKVSDLLQYDSGLSEEQKEDCYCILLAGHLNLAMCHLKRHNFMCAKEHSTKAIEMDVNNIKAYFRRGQALMNLGDAEEAQKDFEKCLSMDSDNKAVAHHLHLSKIKIKRQKEKEKSLYGGMFEKFAKFDAKAAAKRAKADVMAGDLGEWETDGRAEHGNLVRMMNEETYESDDNINEQDFESIRDVQMI